MRSPGLVRLGLGFLAVIAVQVGVWAAFAPQAFYDDFPGVGRVWVGVDGPYNEHLIRDVGALNLALAVVTITALVTLGRTIVLVAAGAWLAYGVPHLVYHLRHLDPLASSDRGPVAVSLAVVVLIAVLLGWTAWRTDDA